MGIETDNPVMDPTGARLLAARIKAGVAVGTRIELVGDAEGPSGLCAGDRGVVDDINERGFVRVIWDRGWWSTSTRTTRTSARSLRKAFPP